MYTLEELNTRLDYLKGISPSGGRHLVEELCESIVAYLARDSEFELQVKKTLDKVIADTFHHNLIYEHQELIEPWQERRGTSPTGYSNVADLFEGNEIFKEIMKVSDREFRVAFYIEEQQQEGVGGGTTSVIYHNTLTEAWVARLQKAVGDELNGLKAIM